MGQTKHFPLYYHLILYTCGFFLFLEWLYPLHLLGTTDHFFVFLLFTQFCFLISFLQLHWVIGNAIKAAAFIFVIQGLFFSTSLFDVEWITLLVEDIRLNIDYMINRDFHLLTGLFRTFLFMGLIWLMSYLVYYWFVTVKKVLVFSICTFVYIGMLDTFSAYDGSWAIARAFLIVAVSFSLTNVMRDAEQTRTIKMFKNHHIKWVIPILTLSILAISLGVFGPKTAGEWKDPIAHITHYFKNDPDQASDGNLDVTRKVGYGENDEHLGGAFEFDETPLFQVNSKEKRYWRVESKEIYTGKGWIAEEREDQWTYSSGNVPLNMQGINVDTQKEEVTVSFEKNEEMNKIVYPYGAKRIESDEPVDQYLIHLTKGMIQPTVNNNVTSLGSYTLNYEFPIFRASELRKVHARNNDSIHESYTQIPSSLPDRVSELAVEITKDYETQYDQVRAVEQYFSEAEFVYETDDVAVPYEEIDYVDEFLFDTQAGYCDNFSSSMAVMLRTLDIPTRWVKGFTGGTDVDESLPKDERVFEITNANAHSWVEVYFAGIGWVPFEPTIGFTGAGDIEEASDAGDVDESEDEELDFTEDALDQDDSEEELDENGEQEDDDDTIASAKENGANNTFLWGVAIIALIAGFIAVYIGRYRIMMHVLLLTLHEKHSEKAIDRSMRFCLYMCRKKGFHKETGETLRVFSQRVDASIGMNDMSKLTKIYEQYMYSNEQRIQMSAYKQIWRTVTSKLLLDR